jgi:tRNA(fMet)-specific endonuclease VapC
LILLDTNICVAHLNGEPRLQVPMQRYVDELAVPTLVAAELHYGFAKSKRVAQNLPRLRQFLASFTAVGFDGESAERAGEIKLHLESIGRKTGAVDLLIGAVALRHNATLVTHNLRHFQDIPGIKLEDWLT